MVGRWVLRGLVLAAVGLAGCGLGGERNADGWWDRGAHAVAGYWINEETQCSLDDGGCGAPGRIARGILLAREPAAVIAAASTAGHVAMGGHDPHELTITLGGLWQPQFVVFDLADGTRRTIAMTCGPDYSLPEHSGETTCWESEFDIWRVRGG